MEKRERDREKDNNLCFLCMEEHDKELVKRNQKTIFKDEEVDYEEQVLYCKNTDEYYSTEEMISENDISMKDAYRKKTGLLTSKEIISIREKFGCSQKSLAIILGLGEKTVTRYENHQVQDKAYDNLLKSLADNPLLFVESLKANKDSLSKDSFRKIFKKTNKIISEYDNHYLELSILAEYEGDYDPIFTGNTNLNLKKVTELVNYFGTIVKDLFLVKLMKLLWYSDFYHYKKTGHGISGLCYFKEKMGALPKAYDKIILLDDVKKETVMIGDNLVDKFVGSKTLTNTVLSKEEIETLEVIAVKFKKYSTAAIVEEMHNEVAYIKTKDKSPMSYDKAESLNI